MWFESHPGSVLPVPLPKGRGCGEGGGCGFKRVPPSGCLPEAVIYEGKPRSMSLCKPPGLLVSSGCTDGTAMRSQAEATPLTTQRRNGHPKVFTHGKGGSPGRGPCLGR